MKKLADLLPDVQLQEHQSRLERESAKAPQRKLLVHALGSGKTLTAIGMAEARGEPYTAIVPAALRNNFRDEIDKWTDKKTLAEVMSYTELAKGKVPENVGTVIASSQAAATTTDRSSDVLSTKRLSRKSFASHLFLTSSD